MSKEVTSEHLLVGLLRADQSLAARCGLTIDWVRNEVTKAPREFRVATGLALSEAAKQVIMLAAEEREHLCHKHTGTEHLLLGIIRSGSDDCENARTERIDHRSCASRSQPEKSMCRMGKG